MAEVIAGVLSKHRSYVTNEDAGGIICDACGWEVASRWQFHKTRTKERMNEHESIAVLAELTKAGYGKLEP